MSLLAFLLATTVFPLFLTNALSLFLVQTVKFFFQLRNTILVVHLRGLFGTDTVSDELLIVFKFLT